MTNQQNLYARIDELHAKLDALHKLVTELAQRGGGGGRQSSAGANPTTGESNSDFKQYPVKTDAKVIGMVEYEARSGKAYTAPCVGERRWNDGNESYILAFGDGSNTFFKDKATCSLTEWPVAVPWEEAKANEFKPPAGTAEVNPQGYAATDDDVPF